MVATFVTLGSSDPAAAQSWVELREDSGVVTNVSAKVSTYTAGGWVGLIHRATLPMQRGSAYSYRCCVGQESSAWFPVHSCPSRPSIPGSLSH